MIIGSQRLVNWDFSGRDPETSCYKGPRSRAWNRYPVAANIDRQPLHVTSASRAEFEVCPPGRANSQTVRSGNVFIVARAVPVSRWRIRQQPRAVGMIANVKATLLQRDRFDFDDGTVVEW
jgi:hypothetical protein